jgi:pimeloyl-ACP methyl ester carboxylesterase
MNWRGLLSIGGLAAAGLWAYAWLDARRFEDLDPDAAPVPGGFLDVDRVRVHYVAAGRGAPVVLIHGLGASTFSYRYTIPELAQRHRVVALDLKGFGFSERSERDDYSLAAQARLVLGAMDRLGIQRAAVVGHSMGGAVAARVALAAPERVERLVLVDAATDRELERSAWLGPLLRPLLPVIALLTLHRRWFRRLSLRSAVHDPAHLTPEVLEGYIRPSRVRGTLRSMGALMAHHRRDKPIAYERIAAPTLILWGEHDRWIPPGRGEQLAARIPNARLRIVASAGHLPLEEQPEVSNKALLDFLGASTSGDGASFGATAQPAR